MSQLDSGLAANAPDVEVDIQQSRLYNDDLAPVPASRRKWGMLSFAALWISMSACIPTYMLASSLIGDGMNWWEAVLTIFLGNLIVLVPMVLNAHAGTKYGIPFPVFCREPDFLPIGGSPRGRSLPAQWTVRLAWRPWTAGTAHTTACPDRRPRSGRIAYISCRCAFRISSRIYIVVSNRSKHFQRAMFEPFLREDW